MLGFGDEPTLNLDERFERCRSNKFTPVELYNLAKTFAVSFEAMARRLAELGLLPLGTYERRGRIAGPRGLVGNAAHVASRGAVRMLEIPLGRR